MELGFLGGSNGKESACNAGDLGLIPGSGRFLGEGNGYSFQYSCLENSIDRGSSGAIFHGGHKELDTTEQLTLSILFHMTWNYFIRLLTSISLSIQM